MNPAAAAERPAREALAALIDRELQRPMPSPAVALATQLAQRAGGATAAVLFYGSALRDAQLDGMLDFYVLLDRASAWPGPRWAAAANLLLPPNVGYIDCVVEGRPLRAKYAVMTLTQFRRKMAADGLDTTLWARFSQPCACVYARSAADAQAAREAVVDAVVTAAGWAAALGPPRGDALAFWRALFTRTYGVELRVERTTRGADLLMADVARYTQLLPLAWREAGLGFSVPAEGEISPALDDAARTAAARRWQRRQRLGHPLNLLRLLKAALTFDNAIDYVAWKVERHSGYKIEPTPFQRRHPLLAAPALYLRLRKQGVLR